MLGFAHRFRIPSEVADHWRLLFDRDFMADVDYCFSGRDRRFLAEWESPDSLYRQCAVQVDRDLPGYVMEALGGVLGWIETWQVDRKQNAMKLSLRPLDSVGVDSPARVSVDLLYLVTARGDDLEIEVIGSVSAALGSIGTRLERLFAGEVERFLHLVMKRQVAWLDEAASQDTRLRTAS